MSNSDQNCHFLSKLSNFDQNFDQICLNWSTLFKVVKIDKNLSKFIKIGKTSKNWSNHVKIGSDLSKSDQTCQILIKVVKIGQNL